MRDLFFPLVLCLTVYAASAQSTESDLTKASTSVPDILITSADIVESSFQEPVQRPPKSVTKPRAQEKSYSIAELEAMTKMQLTAIYLDRISKLYLLLPFIAFDQQDKLSPDDLIGVKVPKGRSNFSSLEKIQEQTVNINKLYEEELASLLPYSDKTDIIRSIIFFQNSVKAIAEGAY